MRIYPKGDPAAPIWIILETPYNQDIPKGYVLGDSFGYHWDKLWNEAGLPPYFAIALKDDADITYDDTTLVQDFINQHNPQGKFFVPLGDRATVLLCPETQKRLKKKVNVAEASLDKYAGNLLTSPYILQDHFVIPSYGPDFICANWWQRDITINIDLGHLREEYNYFASHGCLQPLLQRTLITEPDYETLMSYLSDCRRCPYVGCDIESLYSKHLRTTKNFKQNPGIPYTLGLAQSPTSGISFCFWDYSVSETVEIFKLVDCVLTEVPQIGQNYFCFDAHHLESMGFRLCLERCQDTLLRHHILWPELEHKLQFLTKQYTRQPYYKDEGKGWNVKHKKSLMRYNALDATVTYEVFLAQENDFKDRPHLI